MSFMFGLWLGFGIGVALCCVVLGILLSCARKG